MSRFTNREDLYNKVPLSLNDNRDENIIIDILGNWIPECDIIYYGLLNSNYSNELYKLRNKSMFNIKEIYLENCYFSGDDLIKYLASSDDSLLDLDDDYISRAIDTAINNYFYVPCNETMFRHSIIELSYYKFIKSITLIYPWDIREIDYKYLHTIIPKSVLEKFNVVSGDIISFLESKKDSDMRYTTIVTNSLTEINSMIDNCDRYKTDASFFLLRNDSSNVKHDFIEDPNNPGKKIIDFEEIGTLEILNKLMDLERGVPKTQMRFARYEPVLFSEAKPDPKNFTLGR